MSSHVPTPTLAAQRDSYLDDVRELQAALSVHPGSDATRAALRGVLKQLAEVQRELAGDGPPKTKPSPPSAIRDIVRRMEGRPKPKPKARATPKPKPKARATRATRATRPARSLRRPGRKVLEAIRKDPTLKERSYNEIGRRVGVNAQTVANVFRKLGIKRKVIRYRDRYGNPQLYNKGNR